MPSAPTATLIAKLRKLAKQTSRTGTSSYGQELDRLAQTEGFRAWRDLQAATVRPSTLPVDPLLREDFDNTPHELRPQHELDEWWERPFAVTLPNGHLAVRCLDGGAWDRSTNYGVAQSLVEATTLAREKLERWKKITSQPVALSLGDGMAQAVVMPRMPGDEPHPVSPVMPMAELGAWLERRKQGQNG